MLPEKSDTGYNLSDRAIAFMRRMGWTPERRIDTTAYQELWGRNGYPVFPCTIKFLSMFGELQSDFSVPNGDDFDFDAMDAAKYPCEAYFSQDEKEEHRLVPIGYWGIATVLMDSTGAFCGDVDGRGFIVYGATVEEFIERLVIPKSRNR